MVRLISGRSAKTRKRDTFSPTYSLGSDPLKPVTRSNKDVTKTVAVRPAAATVLAALFKTKAVS